MRSALLAACILALAAPALAQTNIGSTNKYSWSENCGYMNWADADGGLQGVRIGNNFMSGFVWMENVGWLNLGDGSPAGCVYSNTTGADHGVNIHPNGDLYGLAWGENIGWVKFDTAAALSAFGDQARLDRAAQRLRGYAWGENIGWINLDDSNVFVGTTFCRADWDGSGTVNSNDISAFLTSWLESINGATCGADFDGNMAVNSNDISAFLTAWLNAIGGDC